MKKSQVSGLNNLLEEIKIKCNDPKVVSTAKFSYAVIKNKNIIKSEIEALIEVEKEINEIIRPYINARDNKIRELGTEDPSGKIIIPSSDTENINAFKLADAQLQEEYKEIIELSNSKFKDFEKILDEEVNYELYTISVDVVPDFVTPQMFEVLMETGIIE